MLLRKHQISFTISSLIITSRSSVLISFLPNKMASTQQTQEMNQQAQEISHKANQQTQEISHKANEKTQEISHKANDAATQAQV